MAQEPLSGQDLEAKMKEFPCAFNLQYSRAPSRNRFKSLKLKIDEEFKNDADSEEEKIRKKNLLTWVLHCLGKVEKASTLSTEITETTQWKNLASIGNRVFIMWRMGDELEARECHEKLKTMKSRGDFDNLMTGAKAEQAYYYSRLGGGSNLQMAIQLFTDVVKKQPDNYLWKYGLGLVCRRATHANICFSSSQPLDSSSYTKMAAKYLFDVGENADSKLRGMAYSQLVNLRQHYPPHQYPELDADFGNSDIHQLCEKALEHGRSNPVVLTHCGRSLKSIDVDKAIDLLERSIMLRKNTIAYHHLGKSYERKATLIAKGEYHKTFNNTTDPSNVRRQLFDSATGTAEVNGIHCESGHFSLQRSLIASREQGGSSRNSLIQHGDRQQHSQRSPTSTQFHGSFSKRSLSDGTASLMQSPLKCTPLQESDDLVKEAVRWFKESIEFSSGENLPAIFDLGCILKRCGKIKDALIQFNRLTKAAHSREHRITLISAYEMAGLCYLELSKTVEEQNKNDFDREGKNKLTQAVILAVDLAKALPEPTDVAQNVWESFRTLLTKLNSEQPSPNRERQKIKLFEIVEHHGGKIEAILKLRSLSNDELDDLDIIESLINSYLQLRQYVDAIAFLKAGSLKLRTENPDPWKSERMTNLRAKVLLQIIFACLKGGNENSKYWFRQTFELMYGSCTGSDPIDFDEGEENGDAMRDVLVVHDEEQDSEEGQSPVSKSADCVKQVLACLFGLDSEINLEGCPDYGPRLQLQLEEMKKYRVIILLLGDDEGPSMFSTLLTMVPSLETEPSCPAVLVVDTRTGDAAIPLVIRHYRSMKVQLQGVDWLNAAQDEAGYQIAPTGILQIVFDGDVEAVMKLFCFVVGLQWPHLPSFTERPTVMNPQNRTNTQRKKTFI